MTAGINPENIEGILTEVGGRTSHSAILARAMEVPAVLSIENICSIAKNGDKVVLDGTSGEAILNPDDETVEKFKKMYSDYQNEKALLKEYAGKPSQTKDGVKVELVCNIGKPADANKAVECDGEGIGLFRTEFLFMDRDSMPTEEEQFEAITNSSKTKEWVVFMFQTKIWNILVTTDIKCSDDNRFSFHLFCYFLICFKLFFFCRHRISIHK